jgi:hypothetical protein
MNTFIIKINNVLSGVYDNLDLALDYIYSLNCSNLLTNNHNVIIQEIKINSFIILEEYNIDLDFKITKKNKINYNKRINFNHNIEYEDDSISETTNDLKSEQSNTTYENTRKINSKDNISITSSEQDRQKKKFKDFLKKQNELGQSKIDMVHQINLLKKEQEKIKEEENIYENDLILFNKFKLEKEKNIKFIIPYMFEDKFNIFNKLDAESKISFENFKENFIPKKMITTYSNLFEESNIDEKNIICDNSNFINVSNDELLQATNQ